MLKNIAAILVASSLFVAPALAASATAPAATGQTQPVKTVKAQKHAVKHVKHHARAKHVTAVKHAKMKRISKKVRA